MYKHQILSIRIFVENIVFHHIIVVVMNQFIRIKKLFAKIIFIFLLFFFIIKIFKNVIKKNVEKNNQQRDKINT